MKKLINKIQKAPEKSGIYLFKNQKGQIIYIGRSINLKKRLENYLHSKDLKTLSLIKETKDLSIKKTKNLLEAIILEANLIKKYEPKYNIREKDNRSFIYIVIPKKPWSYPFLIRAQQLEQYSITNAKIFGPFQSFNLAKNLLRLLRKIFPYSTCQLNSLRPCFDYQIGLCPGKCVGTINEKEYQQNIDNLILFLKGEKTKIKKILKAKTPEKLKLLENIDDSILISQEKEPFNFNFGKKRIEGYDISHFGGKETFGAMVVFENGDFHKNEYRLFKIKTAKANDDLSALKEMIERRLNHSNWVYPNLILVDGGRAQVNAILKVLEERKINIPVVGISKFQTDKLVFSKIKKSLKEIISLSFDEFKKIRDEAHRFANSARKKLFKKQLFQNK